MRSILLPKSLAFAESIVCPVFKTLLMNWYLLIVSFCCGLLSSDSDFVNEFRISCRSKCAKLTSCVITSHNLYNNWFGKVLCKWLKYSGSISEAFKDGSVDSVL